ncbi:iron-containing alcohol dehydrogenase [Nocardioides sp. BGMRC 2183]|nr:iron-containing alcohol dehydrogenase [Nocardioides sp. BGMRC 2183]
MEVILLSHALRYNAKESTAGLQKIATALGLRQAPPTIASVTSAVGEVTRGLGVPDNLRSVGIEPTDLPEIVRHAMDDWALTRVPRSVTAEDALQILTAAL